MGKGSVNKRKTRGDDAAVIVSDEMFSQWADDDTIPTAIDWITLESVELDPEFCTAAAAKRAAQGLENYARLMGSVEIQLRDVSNKAYAELTAKHYGEIENGVQWDDEGEFNCPRGQIPLSRLLDMEYVKQFKYADANTKDLVLTLLALQSPLSSAWKRPFIRVLTSDTYKPQSRSCNVVLYVYFTRLLFELIADDAIKFVMTHIRPHRSIGRVPVSVRDKPLKLFSKSNHNLNSTDFSLSSLLCRAEDTGFPCRMAAPKGLSVQLFEFQLCSYNWMRHQESISGGLNSQFWEKWDMADGAGPMWYFPLGGEFRLTAPPLAHGGLLCEEMGMGKTVEVLSIILSDPNPAQMKTAISRSPSRSTQPPQAACLVSSRATLIVVPPILVNQWWREMSTRVEPGLLRCINIALLSAKDNELVEVALEDVRLSATEPWGGAVPRVHTAVEIRVPWATSRIVPGVVKYAADTRLTVCFSVPLLMADSDVVLTSYDSFRRHACAYKRIHWHRVVLDECQEVKSSTSEVALECSNLKATNRWMVSGTPFVSSIDDLHGELKFLQVWPFCLPDKVDGFWKKRVQSPYADRSEDALGLLHALIDGVMMRHSKGQSYLDGRPIVALPTRTVEWRGFDLNLASELYLYKYLENFAAEALRHSLIVIEVEEDKPFLKSPRFLLLKSLVGLLSECITSPTTVDLRKLDNLRRRLLPVILPQHAVHAPNPVGGVGSGVPKMSAGSALQQLQSIGQGVAGGLNRSSHRILGNIVLTELEMKLAESHQSKDVATLKEELASLGLPVPMVWQRLKISVDVLRGERYITCYHKPDPPSKDGKSKEAKLKPLSELLKVGDRVRLEHSEALEYDATVSAVYPLSSNRDSARSPSAEHRIALGGVEMAVPWPNEDIESGKLFKHTPSTRVEPYIRLLVARELAMQMPGLTGRSHSSESISERGFETLYKLMAGASVDCPLCLSVEAVRPTVTQCVHVYCFACVVDIVLREGHNAKCPCCRRHIQFESLIEIEPVSETSIGVSAIDDGDERQENNAKSSVKRTRRIAKVAQDESDTAFLVPTFSVDSYAASAKELDALPRPHCPLVPRVAALPSLDSLVLTQVGLWTDHRIEVTARMQAVFDDMSLCLADDPFSKFVIFSQYPESLIALKAKLHLLNGTAVSARAAIVTPTMTPALKAASLKQFNEDPLCNVILLSMGSASSGLTLTVAHVCYLLEPTHNAADEAQALSRVHRIGQTKTTRCVIFYARDTMEERLLAQRQLKGQLTELIQCPNQDLPEQGIGVESDKQTRNAFFAAENMKTLFGLRSE